MAGIQLEQEARREAEHAQREAEATLNQVQEGAAERVSVARVRALMPCLLVV